MPSIPVVLNYTTVPTGTVPDAYGNNWCLRAVYVDGSGVTHDVVRSRYEDGPSLAPFGLDIDLETLFPAGTRTYMGWMSGYSGTEEDSYIEANLSWPDDLGDVTLVRFDVDMGGTGGSAGFMMAARPGYLGGVGGPVLVSTMLQPPRESEALPSADPMPLQLVCEDLFGQIPNNPELGQDGFFAVRNWGLEPLDINGRLVADWGDGTSSDQPFSATLPAATLGYTAFDAGFSLIYRSYMKRLPLLLIRTDESLTEPGEPIVLEDTATSYVMEVHVPRLTHHYETLDNANPTMAARSDAGHCSPQAHDPIPVANFKAVAGEDIDDLDYMHLDGGDSFDLTDTVTVWQWYWQAYMEGVTPPAVPLGDLADLPTYETPILSRPDVEEGDYWVYLYACHLRPGFDHYDPNQNCIQQRSRVRLKRVIVGGSTNVKYDERRASWWHLTGSDGQLTISRHLKFEPPGSAQSVVIGAGLPGALSLAGAHLLATAKNGRFYWSQDEGQSWSYIMPIAPDVSFIAKAVESDGSADYHLVQSAGGTLQRVVVRRTSSGWQADAPEEVSGLPASTRRPGSADKSGTTILLTAKSDDGPFTATSQDNMLTWTVHT